MERRERIPLNMGWLAENGYLVKALNLHGTPFIPGTANGHGYKRLLGPNAKITDEVWADDLTFTVAELLELGFEPGTFKYCECCHRLQAECDDEKRQLADHNKDASCTS